MTRLSIHLATSGRPSLVRMLESVIPQCDPDADEVLVVGHLEKVTSAIGPAWEGWPPGLVKVLPCPPGNDWGHTERNLTMHRASGTHLVFGDDDDVFLPGALETIRDGVEDWPGPVMFRMRDQTGGLLWREPHLILANQGTPQFVVPNDPEKFGVWISRHGGDYDFMVGTALKFGGYQSIKWVRDVIYACREQVPA